MKRRTALAALIALGATALPLCARGQSARRRKPFRIGWAVNILSEGERERSLAQLREFGWTEGRDYTFVESGVPFGQGFDLAAERIVAQDPDLIIVVNTAYAIAVQKRTATIPIVMWVTGYPVEAGLAYSLARPGRNVTGNSGYAGTGIWGKLLELLREARPGLQRVGVMLDYLPPAHPPEEVAPMRAELKGGAGALGLELTIAEVTAPDRVKSGLAELSRARSEALLVTTGPVLLVAREEVLEFALRNRMPTITDWDLLPDIKGLRTTMVYSPPYAELRRRTFEYVVRILRDGAKPGELPIQRPTKFELTIYLASARAIGLTLPQSLLLRADRVIE